MSIRKWRKSSRSGDKTIACVELAPEGGAWYMRDSKNPAGPELFFSGSQLAALLKAAKTGAVA